MPGFLCMAQISFDTCQHKLEKVAANLCDIFETGGSSASKLVQLCLGLAPSVHCYLSHPGGSLWQATLRNKIDNDPATTLWVHLCDRSRTRGSLKCRSNF